MGLHVLINLIYAIATGNQVHSTFRSLKISICSLLYLKSLKDYGGIITNSASMNKLDTS